MDEQTRRVIEHNHKELKEFNNIRNNISRVINMQFSGYGLNDYTTRKLAQAEFFRIFLKSPDDYILQRLLPHPIHKGTL
jgi:hypothetical protein